MNKTTAKSQERIELQDASSIEFWTGELRVSEEQLREALDVVGTDRKAVGAYLAGKQSGLEGFVRDCRRRIEEIEAQIDDLEEECERLSAFLEQFGQLRAQMQTVLPTARDAAASSGGFVEAIFPEKTLNALGRFALDVPQDKPVQLPDGLSKVLSMNIPVVGVQRNGFVAKVTDAVYRLLKDGKRRKLPEILNYLQLRGITFENSKNPAALLSTLLSKDERFIANRKAGWGLFVSIQQEMSDLASGR